MAEPHQWWIIGASEGLGREIARRLDAEGASLVLSARNGERLAALASELTYARALPLDVTDASSVAKAADAAGEVEGLIYSVGLYEPMSARDWDTAAAVAMTQANYVGALHVLGHVLPGMIARGRGRLVLIGSLAGFRGLPGAIGYGASKAALMHLAENLHADLRGTGVRVQVINPGFVDTRLTRKNNFHMPFLMTPETAAERICRAIARGGFSTSFPNPFALFFRLAACLPLRLVHLIF